MRDAPARPGALHELQLHAQLHRTLPHRRRRQRLVAKRSRRRRHDRLRLNRTRHRRRLWSGRRLLLVNLRRRRRSNSSSLRRASPLHRRFIAGALDLKLHQRRADRRHRARLAMQRQHLASHRRRHLDRRLVRHDVDEVLVLADDVTHLHMPRNDLGLGRAFAHIRKLEYEFAHGPYASRTRRMASPIRCGPGKYCHSKACG